MHKGPQIRLFLFDGKPDANHSTLEKRKESIGTAALAVQEKSRLGEDRLAGYQRRTKLFDDHA